MRTRGLGSARRSSPATTVAGLAADASPSLADIGSVFVDGRLNVAAGANLSNASVSGTASAGLADPVMPNLTTGSHDAAIGSDAIFADTTGDGNVALGSGAGDDLLTGSDNIDIANAGQTGDLRTIPMRGQPDGGVLGGGPGGPLR